MVTTKELFNPLGDVGHIEDEHYQCMQQYFASLKSISKLMNLSCYLIDYSRKNFPYVSQHPLFLSGYSVSEVKELGYDFYLKVVSEEDLRLLSEFNRKGAEFFYKIPLHRRKECYISYDFALMHRNGSKTRINHKLIPVLLTEAGDIWIALCLVSLSVESSSGNAFIQFLDNGEKFQYSRIRKCFKSAEMPRLSERERIVLQHLAQGCTTTEVAISLNISRDTVKYHRKRICVKLSVRNITEAVYFAANNRLI